SKAFSFFCNYYNTKIFLWQRNGITLSFALFRNKVVVSLLKVGAFLFEVAATYQKFFRSCRFWSEVELLRVKVAF
ncbi:hypothetical protein NE670_23500, partial [Flavonifractor plautii]|uniref:hypothetical protein n=1 Tax=Flavonifractor plautii TaxID=292800 RepID=UPI00210C1138